MNRLPFLGSVALLAVLAPLDARACSLSGFPMVQVPRGAHLIATAGADTVEAGPGDVRYVVSDGHYGPAGERVVYGQVVEVERIGGMAARGLDASVTRVVLVPWDYGADCRPTPWTRSARWVEPGTRGLFTATLRDRAHWVGDLPTFDVHTPGNDPYPQRNDAYIEGDSVELLSMDEYFAVLDLLPSADRADSSAAEAYAPLLRWAERHPELAGRYPLRSMLRYLRHDLAYQRLRTISPPIAGTWRFEARLGDEAPRAFYVRTRTRPTTGWNLIPPDFDAEEPEEPGEPDGYSLLSSGALSPDSLPFDCGPTRRMDREGYMGVLMGPEPGADPRTWRGTLEMSLLLSHFPADSALRSFAKAYEDRSYERYTRREPNETPARFVLAGDGSMRVEQRLRLDDGRTLRMAGTRISRETIAEPE